MILRSESLSRAELTHANAALQAVLLQAKSEEKENSDRSFDRFILSECLSLLEEKALSWFSGSRAGTTVSGVSHATSRVGQETEPGAGRPGGEGKEITVQWLWFIGFYSKIIIKDFCRSASAAGLTGTKKICVVLLPSHCALRPLPSALATLFLPLPFSPSTFFSFFESLVLPFT